LISGCQDDQTSADLPSNGLFTQTLKAIWDNGRFQGDFAQFKSEIAASMGDKDQQPNLFPYGPTVGEFLRERPFGTAKSMSPRIDTLKADAANDGDLDMTASRLHPSVYEVLRSTGNKRAGNGGPNPGPANQERVVEGGCFVKFGRSLFDGKSNEEIFEFFREVVAPEMCSNYFVARDAFSGKTPRGGSVSCTASTSDGGSVSCTGTWTF
jgi:hypothetical protein